MELIIKKGKVIKVLKEKEKPKTPLKPRITPELESGGLTPDDLKIDPNAKSIFHIGEEWQK